MRQAGGDATDEEMGDDGDPTPIRRPVRSNSLRQYSPGQPAEGMERRKDSCGRRTSVGSPPRRYRSPLALRVGAGVTRYNGGKISIGDLEWRNHSKWRSQRGF